MPQDDSIIIEIKDRLLFEVVFWHWCKVSLFEIIEISTKLLSKVKKFIEKGKCKLSAKEKIIVMSNL